MTAEIATIRTAAETARATTPTDLASLDPATLAAVTDVLRAAADLTRAQRPIILHTPAPAPAVAPDTAAHGAYVHLPGPPTPAAAAAARAFRPAHWGEKLLWFGMGAALAGVVGALIATVAGIPWALLTSAAGASLCPVGGAALFHADRRAQERP